jgi:uroporphyrinogen decarboxylase
MATSGLRRAGLDWTVNLGKARALVGGTSKGFAGQYRPQCAVCPPAQIEAEVAKVLDSFGAPHTGAGTGATHIFNLGHGISQHTPPEMWPCWSRQCMLHSRKMRAGFFGFASSSTLFGWFQVRGR